MTVKALIAAGLIALLAGGSGPALGSVQRAPRVYNSARYNRTRMSMSNRAAARKVPKKARPARKVSESTGRGTGGERRPQ